MARASRPWRKKKLIGNLYVTVAVIASLGMFYLYYSKYIPRFGCKLFIVEIWPTISLCVYSVFALMYSWCYIKTQMTDPGQIPIYWGFKVGSSSDTRKRYCVICNLFKPDWTHHCSACNMCVLNMDHHCPWLNSCIGFWNWKSFILLLMYLWLTVFTFGVSFWYEYKNIGLAVYNIVTRF